MSNERGVDSAMMLLREHMVGNVLDYQFAMHMLRTYRSPRAKLSRLVKSEALIHIKKGLYLLGQELRREPYLPEQIANLLYGPSYVSLEWALRMYGLIPEHVEAVTSVTLKDTNEFRTPLGNFLYAHIHPQGYAVGVTMMRPSDTNILIATPEKALTDMLMLKRGKITSMHQIEEILFEDLRIEEDDLRALDLLLIQKIYQAYPHSAIFFLEKFFRYLKEHQHE